MSGWLAHTIEAPSLPRLIDRAARRLAEARTSAEALEARKLAEAALALARVTKAANETQADCLRMIVRAESLMADQIDRGQQAGELATKEGRPTSVQLSDTSAPTTLDEIGVDRRRLAEWRKIRDAGEDAIECAIQKVLDEGRAPTKADLAQATHFRGHFTGENEWYTPPAHLEAARRTLGDIELDAASSEQAQATVQARRFLTQDDDALQHEWRGKVWLNPPYSQPLIQRFVEKLAAEYRAGRVSEAILLTHNHTDTAWFHQIFEAASAICFTRGRVKFQRFDGVSAAPVQGQAFTYFGNRPEAFAVAFSQFGTVIEVRTLAGDRQ